MSPARPIAPGLSPANGLGALPLGIDYRERLALVIERASPDSKGRRLGRP